MVYSFQNQFQTLPLIAIRYIPNIQFIFIINLAIQKIKFPENHEHKD